MDSKTAKKLDDVLTSINYSLSIEWGKISKLLKDEKMSVEKKQKKILLCAKLEEDNIDKALRKYNSILSKAGEKEVTMEELLVAANAHTKEDFKNPSEIVTPVLLYEIVTAAIKVSPNAFDVLILRMVELPANVLFSLLTMSQEERDKFFDNATKNKQ